MAAEALPAEEGVVMAEVLGVEEGDNMREMIVGEVVDERPTQDLPPGPSPLGYIVNRWKAHDGEHLAGRMLGFQVETPASRQRGDPAETNRAKCRGSFSPQTNGTQTPASVWHAGRGIHCAATMAVRGHFLTRAGAGCTTSSTDGKRTTVRVGRVSCSGSMVITQSSRGGGGSRGAGTRSCGNCFQQTNGILPASAWHAARGTRYAAIMGLRERSLTRAAASCITS